MTTATIGLICLMASAVILFTSRHWGRNLAALGFLYLSHFLILIENWPFELAAIKLVAGWMAIAVLISARLAPESLFEQDAGLIFRSLVFAVLLMVAWSIAPGAEGWIPGIVFEAAFGGLFVVILGLFRTGFVQVPAQIILSLLATLSGFELLFSAIDSSALMTSMLAALNLSLAMTGAYFGAAAVEEGNL